LSGASFPHFQKFFVFLALAIASSLSLLSVMVIVGGVGAELGGGSVKGGGGSMIRVVLGQGGGLRIALSFKAGNFCIPTTQHTRCWGNAERTWAKNHPRVTWYNNRESTIGKFTISMDCNCASVVACIIMLHVTLIMLHVTLFYRRTHFCLEHTKVCLNTRLCVRTHFCVFVCPSPFSSIGVKLVQGRYIGSSV
jgi:hypothetical protein